MTDMPKLVYWLRPVCPHVDRIGPNIGPFDGPILQLEDTIYVGENQIKIGWSCGLGDFFFPVDMSNGQPMPVKAGEMKNCTLATWHVMYWDGLVIWAEVVDEVA